MLNACSSENPPPKGGEAGVLTESEMSREVERLARQLTCAKRVRLESDQLVFDPAKGQDCIKHDGSAVFVRVYSHTDTLPRVISEWSPTFGHDRRWVRGEHWLVMGAEGDLRRIATDEGASPPSSEAPAKAQVSPDDARLDMCMSFVSSAAARYVSEDDATAAQLKTLNEEYPGAAAVIEGVLTSEAVTAMSGLNDYEQSAYLSRFGGQFREICRGAARGAP